MLAKSSSFGLSGLDAYPVIIETDVGRGLPSITVVGLPDTALRESRERVRAALRNSGFDFPKGRVTINLAPADIKKEGPAFDLAMALGILAASEQIPAPALEGFAFLGELSLDGQIKPVPGAFTCALAAPQENFKGILLPAANADEAALAGRTAVFPAATLQDAVDLLVQHHAGGATTPAPWRSNLSSNASTSPEGLPDFEDVKGQASVKRGLEIAAAGGHNVLMIGPPGSGKTMLARRFPTILPAMTREETLETTRIHSSAGILACHGALLAMRPFRTPHHTASHIALVGGGTDPRPGEVTLAHHGVLFLDELPEFTRGALEALRQPLEDGHVTVARAARTMKFPAKFALLAAMNPCPCGHLTNRRKKCTCLSPAIQRYRQKISGPLLDRIDIHLEVPALDTAQLMGQDATTPTPSAIIRKRVEAARSIQTARLGHSGGACNSRMSTRQLKKHCVLDLRGQELLRNAVDTLGLSARAHDKVLRVARTIADIDEADTISPAHLAEAISYRCLDKSN